jgi:hypothetical protein
MCAPRKQFSSAWFGVLVLSVAGGLSPSASRSQEKNELSKELELSYQDFDQRPGGGWRKIADKGKYLEAAKLIDQYEKKKQGLEEWQRVNLRFHAGQLYAFADQKDQALARFKTAIFAKEPADSPLRWNAYVRATIAFLERDRKKLTELREEIAKGPKLEGAVPNLDVVDRLIKHFDEPYSVAYRGKPKEPPDPRDLETLWGNLGTSDPVVAHQAISALVARPAETVPFLGKRLRPVCRPDPNRLTELLAKLDDERFKVRERATRELENLAETAEPGLKKTLASEPSPEARRRIEKVLEKLKNDRLHPPADRMRLVRAVEVLEMIGSAEARQVLTDLARGAPEAQLTLEAKTALERLSR